MKTAFLNALTEAEELPRFSDLSSSGFDLFRDFKEYRGLVLRLYTGSSGQQWKELQLHEASRFSIDELYDLRAETLPERRVQIGRAHV